MTVYLSRSWEGAPLETEEMRPRWYKINDLPFDSMWPDDKYWLPQVLSGSRIKGEFLFGKKDRVMDFNVSRWEGV